MGYDYESRDHAMWLACGTGPNYQHGHAFRLSAMFCAWAQPGDHGAGGVGASLELVPYVPI